LLAAGLVVVDNSTAHTAIVNKLDSSVGGGAAGGSLSAAGLSGTLDSFFTIHAALGFILVLVALVLTALANAVALAAGGTARPSVPPAPPPGGVTG
jgi:hypothetical protein